MYSVRIYYGLDTDRVKVYTNEKELKKAFKNEKEYDKYIEKIKKEVNSKFGRESKR